MKVRVKTSKSKFDEMLGSSNFFGFIFYILLAVFTGEGIDVSGFKPGELGGSAASGDWSHVLKVLSPLLYVFFIKVKDGFNWAMFRSFNFYTTLLIGALLLLQGFGIDIPFDAANEFLNALFDGSTTQAITLGAAIINIVIHSLKGKKLPSPSDIKRIQRDKLIIKFN